MAAFNGDSFIEAELGRLVTKWSIATIVETGTYQGDSTKAFTKLGPDVITIEMDWFRFNSTTELDKVRHLTRLNGDSPRVLGRILVDIERPILFYLDAHWLAHSPLLDELAEIARAHNRCADRYPVIAIHDFFNPVHPDYSFDSWDIGAYQLELVSASLDRIYGPRGWHHYFNDQSDAQPPRGILYVEPCE